MTSPETLPSLAAKVPAAEGPDRELDAAIVAALNNATVKRYPPATDFGPHDRWQFWSLDGAHFLGSEAKFPVPAYTASIDAALTLVPEGVAVELATGAARLSDARVDWKHAGLARTPALALCAAALKARAAQAGEAEGGDATTGSVHEHAAPEGSAPND